MSDRRSNRRMYTAQEKNAALHLVREVGTVEASLRLGIPQATLYDWKAQTKAYAYSPYVGRGRKIAEEERARLIAQLVHEQELELRFIGQRNYRNDPKGRTQGTREPLDVLLSRTGTTARHLLEWLDPTFDEVAERLAA